jgi:phosphate transport system substrate-binding protein
MLAVGTLGLAACGTNNNSTTAATTAATTSGSSTSGSSPSASAASAGAIQCNGASGTLNASGSTAQANAMSQWEKDFQTACPGTTVNYTGGGSGKGVTDFTAGTTDFAGSDFALSSTQKSAADKRCGTGNQAIDLPMVPGPIAVGYNLPGVSNLNLSAATLAKIFDGSVTKWDDATIKADNPGVTLPSTGIQTFHRSDGSGTTFNFTNYLQNDAPSAWTFGHDKTWKAPGGQGSKGTAGIAQGVKSTPGGIGYMELSFAKNSNIPYAKVGNAQGKFVELTTPNVVNFLSKATVTGKGDDLALTFDYANPDTNAYPAVLVTYEIVCQKGTSAAKLPTLKSFMGYLAGSGQDLLEQNNYVKLPANINAKVVTAVGSMS